jgi:predicted Zn finger-like uncharacterized protein
MYTRCPNCDTYFRVTREQLQASSGQVRCGRCESLFDAFATLTSQLPVTPASVPPEPYERGARRADPAPPEHIVPHKFKSEEPSVGADASGTSELLTLPEDLFTPGVVVPESGPRWLWTAASAVLLIALLGQALFFYGSNLATSAPSLRSVLTSACNMLGCRIALARIPDQLFIESSDLQVLNPARTNEIVLTATIRNRAQVPQELPALELTLTDALNQPAARKVFYPVDYVQQDLSIADGIAPNQEILVKLYLNTNDLKPTGYRLYLFFA